MTSAFRGLHLSLGLLVPSWESGRLPVLWPRSIALPNLPSLGLCILRSYDSAFLISCRFGMAWRPAAFLHVSYSS